MATKTSKGVMMENKKRSVKTKAASASRREVPESKRKDSASRRKAVQRVPLIAIVGMKSYAMSGAGAKKKSSKIRKRVSKGSSRKNKTSRNLSKFAVKGTKSDIKSLTILVRVRDAKGRFATNDSIGEEMSLTIDLPIRKSSSNGTTETFIKNEKH